MATSPGWGSLGSAIAGGNSLNASLAYDQGQSLGARTQDALAQARARIDENNASEHLDETLSGIPGLEDPKLRAGVVSLLQAKKNPEETFHAIGTNFQNTQRMKVANPATSDDDAARAMYSIGNSDSQIKPVGEFQSTNVLHPSQGVQATDLGTQLAGAKLDSQRATTSNAESEAALHRDQVAHPEKYRIVAPPAAPGSDGSTPVAQETYAQLVAQGLAPMPTPGRALIQMGGEDFTRRVNYLAGKQGGAQQPPAAAPGATPAVGAPPAAGSAPATPAPFQANFDTNSYGQRRTSLNDLSRKNGTGGNDDALNRTAGHLDVYEELMKNSGNSNFVPSNQIKNAFQQATGQAYPNNAKLAAQVLGTEIVKSMTSVGAGTGEERMGLGHAFSAASSLPQASGAIDTAQRLLREQAVGTNQRITASGVKDYYTKYLTPTTRRRLSLGEFDPANQQGAAPAAAPAAAGGGVDNDPLGIRGK